MTNFIRTLVMCGAAAVALTATAARADGREGEAGEHAAVAEWREHGEQSHEWREHGDQSREWRERRELDEQWRELAVARERFYATWRGNPWRRARFERWYGVRRDQLARLADHERREDHERDGRWRR